MVTRVRVRVRRAPRYPAFLVTGTVLGLLVAVVSGFTGPVDPTVGRGQLVGYLAIGFGLLGLLLGALVAIAIETLSRRSR